MCCMVIILMRNMRLMKMIKMMKMMNVMKMVVVICCGKDEIVPMGVNMSGLCRALLPPPPLPDARSWSRFDHDELISCTCCFNVRGVQKVRTTLCWYEWFKWHTVLSLRLTCWWLCVDIEGFSSGGDDIVNKCLGRVNQLMPQQLWGCRWSCQNLQI